jgi:hypothetical protein
MDGALTFLARCGIALTGRLRFPLVAVLMGRLRFSLVAVLTGRLRFPLVAAWKGRLRFSLIAVLTGRLRFPLVVAMPRAGRSRPPVFYTMSTLVRCPATNHAAANSTPVKMSDTIQHAASDGIQ